MIVLLAVATSGTAGADQNDPRLDGLFGELKQAKDPDEARNLEFVIWQIWMTSDDPVINTLMVQGVSAMGRKDNRLALSKFEQIVAIAPDFAEGWNKRATVHYLTGAYTKSLTDIDRTLALEPRHFGALSGRGLVYAELAEEALALESFEAALAIHPHLAGAQENARRLRERLGDQRI